MIRHARYRMLGQVAPTGSLAVCNAERIRSESREILRSAWESGAVVEVADRAKTKRQRLAEMNGEKPGDTKRPRLTGTGAPA